MSIPLNGPGPVLNETLTLETVGPGGRGDAAIAIGTPLDAPCSQCKRPLRALVDLDLRDPRLAFVLRGLAQTAQPPTRLRIPACEQCTNGWFIYTDVDVSGGVHNARVRPRPSRESRNPFTGATQRFRGSEDRIPVDPNANWNPLSVRVLSASFSPDTPWTRMTIGGMIRSEQEWEWPKCIRCEKLMTYVATIAHGLDGQCYYGFWCPGCGVATSYSDVD